MRRYKREMSEAEWLMYFNMSTDECKANGVSFGPLFTNDPYIEIDDSSLRDELQYEHSRYTEYMEMFSGNRNKASPEDDCA